MAMEPENHCPICLDNFIENSYLMPCAHKFCFACILRWAESKPECPLCKRAAHSIVRMVLVNDGLDNICPALTVSAVVDPQDYPSLLRSIPPWMYQELQVLFGNESSLTAIMQNIIIPFLAIFSLDEELLVQLLGPSFRNCTVAFEHQVIELPVQWHRREAFSLRQDNSPRGASFMAVPGPSHSPEGTSAEDLPGISAAALGGDSTSPPSASTLVLGVQEEILEEPEEAVAHPERAGSFPLGGHSRP